MFKYSLIVLVLWCQIQDIVVQNDTEMHNLSLHGNATRYTNSTSEIADNSTNPAIKDLNKTLEIKVSGYNNCHVDQQVFYLYNEQQLKQLLSDNKNVKKVRDDYLITPGLGGHKLHPRAVTWNFARRACNQEGAHLAIINSAVEEKILLHMMQEKGIIESWLGLHDLYEEGDWISILDETLESTGYTKWTTKWSNEPNNGGGNQNCASLISPEGGMDDKRCNVSISFFCEIPA